MAQPQDGNFVVLFVFERERALAHASTDHQCFLSCLVLNRVQPMAQPQDDNFVVLFCF